MKTTSDNLKQLREAKRYTQEEMGKIIAVKREMISYYENGSREISITNLNVILKFFGLTIEEFKNKKFENSVEIAYRKEKMEPEDFEDIILLNTFVSNLNFIKKLNK